MYRFGAARSTNRSGGSGIAAPVGGSSSPRTSVRNVTRENVRIDDTAIVATSSVRARSRQHATTCFGSSATPPCPGPVQRVRPPTAPLLSPATIAGVAPEQRTAIRLPQPAPDPASGDRRQDDLPVRLAVDARASRQLPPADAITSRTFTMDKCCRLTLKGLWAHKLRFVLTGLAVILGVAFMAGTMILTDTMGKTFDGLFATTNEGIDVVVRRESASTATMASTSGSESTRRPRRRARASTASTPRPARSRASPSSSTPTARRGIHTTARRHDRRQLDRRRAAQPVRARRPAALPRRPDEVVLDQATVDDEGWAIGDTFARARQGRHRSS